MSEDTRSEWIDNDSVRVFVNGSPVVVPHKVDDHWAARGVLGVPRGLGVGYEFTLEPLSFKNGHEFIEGEHYEIIEFQLWLDKFEVEEEEPTDQSWLQSPDWWKQ